MGFTVSILGVRGSYSSSKTRPSTFGSHTTCVLVQAGQRLLMLDAGSGATNADAAKIRAWPACDFSLLLTHYHHDHVIGFPFMARPSDGALDVLGPRLGETGPEAALRRMVAPPLFPVNLEALGPITFEEFDLQPQHFDRGNVRIKTFPVNHPGGAVAYRIEYEGAAFCFVPDIELPSQADGSFDPDLLAFLAQADALMMDAAYSVEEFHKFIGWGHSHWRQGLQLAELAGVRRFLPTHFNPTYSDEEIASWEEAGKEYAETVKVEFSREGVILDIG